MKTTMRDIVKVTAAMKAEVPEGHALHHWFDLFVKDCSYKAPEQMIYQWHKLADILNTFALPADDDWKHRIADIFADEQEPNET